MKNHFAIQPRDGNITARVQMAGGWIAVDYRTRLPAEAEIAEINSKHLIDTPLKPADLLFVFGTREDVALRVDTAFRLRHEGFFRWAIVSGGVTPGSPRHGMRTHRRAALARAGIPSSSF